MSDEFKALYNLLLTVEKQNVMHGALYDEIFNCIIATNSEGKLCFFDVKAIPIPDSNFDIQKKSDVEKMDAKERTEYYKKHHVEYPIGNEMYIIKTKK